MLDKPGPAGDRPALVVGDLARFLLGVAAGLPSGAELGPAAAEGVFVEDLGGRVAAGDFWLAVLAVCDQAWWQVVVAVWLKWAAVAAKSGSHLAGCRRVAVTLAVEQGLNQSGYGWMPSLRQNVWAFHVHHSQLDWVQVLVFFNVCSYRSGSFPFVLQSTIFKN